MTKRGMRRWVWYGVASLVVTLACAMAGVVVVNTSGKGAYTLVGTTFERRSALAERAYRLGHPLAGIIGDGSEGEGGRPTAREGEIEIPAEAEEVIRSGWPLRWLSATSEFPSDAERAANECVWIRRGDRSVWLYDVGGNRDMLVVRGGVVLEWGSAGEGVAIPATASPLKLFLSWIMIGAVISMSGEGLRFWVRRRRGMCSLCGYDVRGLAVCPECGAAVA